MTVTLDDDTLRIPADALRQLRDMGFADGDRFDLRVEDGRLVAIPVGRARAESEEDARAALREAQESWGPGAGLDRLADLRADERSHE